MEAAFDLYLAVDVVDVAFYCGEGDKGEVGYLLVAVAFENEGDDLTLSVADVVDLVKLLSRRGDVVKLIFGFEQVVSGGEVEGQQVPGDVEEWGKEEHTCRFIAEKVIHDKGGDKESAYDGHGQPYLLQHRLLQATVIDEGYCQGVNYGHCGERGKDVQSLKQLKVRVNKDYGEQVFHQHSKRDDKGDSIYDRGEGDFEKGMDKVGYRPDSQQNGDIRQEQQGERDILNTAKGGQVGEKQPGKNLDGN